MYTILTYSSYVYIELVEIGNSFDETIFAVEAIICSDLPNSINARLFSAHFHFSSWVSERIHEQYIQLIYLSLYKSAVILCMEDLNGVHQRQNEFNLF